MKIYIICIAYLLFCSTMVAQNYYYNVDKTFKENGYTYQCDVLEKAKFVTLYNKENKFTYVNQVDRHTEQVISIEENMQEKQLEDDSWTKQKCYSIINGAFSKEEKVRVKGRSFGITMFIDPNTGKIAEVNYKFTCMNPYATIPISVFRQIEVELKKYVWFVPTELGKRRNYIIVGWRHEVR